MVAHCCKQLSAQTGKPFFIQKQVFSFYDQVAIMFDFIAKIIAKETFTILSYIRSTGVNDLHA